MSSRYTATLPLAMRSAKIVFIRAWNIAGEFVRPKNMTWCYALSLISVSCPHYAAYLSLTSSSVPPDRWLPSTGLISDFAAISILSSFVHFCPLCLPSYFVLIAHASSDYPQSKSPPSICGMRASFLQLLPHSLGYLLSTLLRISQLISKGSADRLQL